jgi:hypothetical protein
MGIGPAWLSSRALAVPALALVLVGALVRVVRRRRAFAARRARLHLAMLRAIAQLTELGVDDLAPLFGAAPADVPAWERHGVPARRQLVVAHLLRTATALRRELPPSVARALLALRARRSAIQREAEELLAELARR